jgi:choline dehydrogenase-like flavoprotein
MKDVVIIGSGAGGAPLALKLSQAGFDVLVLEKGPRYERSDYQHDEVRSVGGRSWFQPSVQEEPHVLIDHTRPHAAPRLTTLGWIACCVGGGTSHMGGAFFRFHADDFHLATRCGAYEEIADWPYGYQELEPHYSEAEWLIGVSGLDRANPFEGFRSRSYPMPPLQSHFLTPYFDRACRKLGLNPFPTPRAVNSEPYRGRPACVYCDYCAGFGCPTGARGSTQESLLPWAERTGRCEIRSEAMVREITIDHHGRAAGCIYIDKSGTEHRVRASMICVCCSAVESARLLLLSASPSFRDGLANGSGLVGRHLQFHAGSTGCSRFRYDRHPALRLRDGRPFLQRSLMDHYFLPQGVTAFPKGGVHRFNFAPLWPIHIARELAMTAEQGLLWGRKLKDALKAHFTEARGIDFEVYHDFLPNRGTFVELDPQVKDKWGLPVARIHLTEPEHHRVTGGWLVNRGLEVLDGMGADELSVHGVGYTNGVMTHGTCRAGNDPTRSVLNEFCRAHEVPNLFVVDGSFMPTSGGAPSTLTIVANSLRTADHIIARAGSASW